MTSANRPPFPAPVPSEENAPFWDALRRGELLLQACASCGRYQHPPRPMCGDCGSMERDWKAVSGRGSVYSYVVTHQAVHPAYQGFTPYATVLVALDEGPRMTTNLVGVAPEEIEIGMRVEVVFEAISDEVTLPLFRRA
ncbi:MAG: Zn-ribbon domain-containing OB-fold protein [Dehalococcoidia bacterium]